MSDLTNRTIRAVIFDMDGVLIDSEQIWERVRREYVPAHGGTYSEDITGAVMGMSAPEWSEYLRVYARVEGTAQQIDDDIVALMAASYRSHLPLFPGVSAIVRRIAEHVPLALASSSNRTLIDLVLQLAHIDDAFTAVVSSEEVARGKPAPDVYVRAAELLGFAATDCGAVEDSSNGIRSAHAAGCFVVALPHPQFPPAAEALALADVTLGGIRQLTPATFGFS